MPEAPAAIMPAHNGSPSPPDEVLAPERRGLREFLLAGTVLGSYAVAATVAEAGHLLEVSQPLLAFQTSGRHPFMGLMAAGFALRFLGLKSVPMVAGFAAAVNATSDVVEAAIFSGVNHIPDIVSSGRIVDNTIDLGVTVATAAWWTTRERRRLREA